MIKDQCNNCRKYNTSSCGQAIVYNSLSCEFYVKKLDLSKPTDKPTSSPVTNPQPQSVPQPVPQPQPQPNSPSNNSISAEPRSGRCSFRSREESDAHVIGSRAFVRNYSSCRQTLQTMTCLKALPYLPC